MDKLKRFIAQRYALAPAICLTIGIVLHFKGVKLSDRDRDNLQQFVASIFDILALVSGQSAARYSLSQKKQENIKTAVDTNAAILDRNTPSGESPVTVEQVAKAEEAKK